MLIKHLHHADKILKGLRMRHISLFWVLLIVIFSFACSHEKRYSEALSPEQALESFQLSEGFTIEVFASEPQVMDPVSMIFDEQGNIFVVEMPDYPYKPKAGEGQGRIKKLIDNDQDGKIDESIVFAENLSEATSILPWKGGLLVTSAPNILYLQDTDGDHKADSEEILFSGFFENNSEAQISNLRFSVDNWIYAANHGQAGEVSFSRKPDAPKLPMQGGDFRFRLDKDAFELATGPAQFGQAIDDWGNKFITQNTIHIRHAVIPKRYVDRNPHKPITSAVLNVSDHDLRMYQETPAPYWRAERSRRRQQTYDEQGLDRVEYAEDHFTGASGGTIYTGEAFPKEFYGNIFTGDVAGNLIHRDVLRPLRDSPTFVASRDASETEREFLASTDPWFRPVNFTVGPDGFLYVIDMYRQHIETPVSIPDDLKEDMDFMNGSERGRIYRIKPLASESKEKIIPNLREMESKKLLTFLTHPNQWWRLQTQRLLIERQDLSVLSEVESMFYEHEDARVRLHSLYVLEGLNALSQEHLKRAMHDPHAGVREHAIILSERFPEMLSSIMECLKDSSTRVSFQASLSLGEFSESEVVSALADVLVQKGENEWFRTAVLSATSTSSLAFMKTVLEKDSFLNEVLPWKLNFVQDISHSIGSKNNKEEIIAYLAYLSSLGSDWQASGVAGLMKGLQKNDDERLNTVIKQMEENQDLAPEKAIETLSTYFSKST